jgi:hypothetical protein
MGYTVLHINKASGNDVGMSAHIERTIAPNNADRNRTYLNRELMTLPNGVKNRTEAIQHRIETAGITRKIGKNQVRALRIMLSATSEDMKRIEATGKLDEWCTDSIDWLRDTFGNDNLVSAVLHMDEKTPHIHATVIPVVSGERRKAKAAKSDDGKKKYRKKNPDAARLCADDVMARDKLKHYQDTYAERMQKYGLKRGIEGSEAKHINTQQYYRDLHLKAETLQENIGNLAKLEQQAQQNLSHIKSEIKTEKLKSSAVDVATSAIEGIGSVFGASKAKKQQQEIEALKSENVALQIEIQTLQGQIQTNEKKYAKTTDNFRREMEKIYALFPKIKELLRIANLCRHLGFGEELTKKILEMKPVAFKGELYSAEYQCNFKTENSVAEVKPSINEPDELRLTIDGLSDVGWFRQQYREFLQKIGLKVKQRLRSGNGKSVSNL